MIKFLQFPRHSTKRDIEQILQIVVNREPNQTLCDDLNISRDVLHLLQLGVYRNLSRERNQTLCVDLNTSRDVYTFYNWVCIGISRGHQIIPILPLLIPREMFTPFTIGCV